MYMKTKQQRKRQQRKTKRQRRIHKGGRDLRKTLYKLETPYTNAELHEIRRHAEEARRQAEAEARRQAEANADEQPYADGEQPAALRALLRWG